MNGDGTSPLLARQDSSNYTIIFIALALILIILLAYVIIKWISSIHTSPKWIEMHKNLPTTKKNVQHVAKSADLNTNESLLLEDICHSFKVPNIEYFIRDDKAIDELFKKEFHLLCERSNTEPLKSTLFGLRYKIEKAHNNSIIISSTKSILPGQDLNYTDLRGSLWILTLKENNAQGLFLSMPGSLATSNLKPDPLSKLDLNFTSKNGVSYFMNLRVIRYEQDKEGQPLILLGHTNTLKAMQRRNVKRMLVNKKCEFSAVEVVPSGTASTDVSYKPKEMRHEGLLQDISSTGCRLTCSLPIKQGQYIYVEFCIDGKKTENAVGLIIKTTQSLDTEQYVLHIQFVKIDLSVRNSIYAVIYQYEEP